MIPDPKDELEDLILVRTEYQATVSSQIQMLQMYMCGRFHRLYQLIYSTLKMAMQLIFTIISTL